MKGEQNFRQRLKNICNAQTAVKIFFTAFLLVSLVGILGGGGYTDLSFGGARLVPRLIVILFFAAILTALEIFLDKYKAVEWTMLLSATAFSLAVVMLGNEEIRYRVYLGLLVAMFVVINYVSNSGAFDLLPKEMGKVGRWCLPVAFSLIACAMVAAIGVYRYLSFAAPNYDFGIWCNMFYNMTESGLPYTTCERDGLLSHFAVHFSPIYYVMLPFYAIFPTPETLQISQAVVLYSGIVPLCLIARNKGLSDRAIAVLGFVYAFYPAIATGTFYDLHENCFLLPLLLWCFYFFESEKHLPMWIFSGLVLLVKEDAFIYLLIFAVYIFFQKGKRKIALIMAVAALAYFLAVSSFMSSFGNGVMAWRYENLVANESDGLLGVVKTAILNPGYLFTQLFVSKNNDGTKLLYVIQLLFTLALVPFATKRISRYLLIVPILMNLITMYVYQPNIKFQYSFGITAFLFYVAVLNLSELGESARKLVLPVSAVASLLMFAMLVSGNFNYYSQRYLNEKESYKQMEATLCEVLPSDASVNCSTFLLPHIADRSEIYEVTYHKENGKYKTDAEFVALDMRYKDESEAQAAYFLENGYEEYYNDGGYVLVLKKKLDN